MTEPAVHSKDGLNIRAYASTAMIPDDTNGHFKALTTDPAIEQWEPPERETLSPCFADAPSVPKLEGRATVEFDAAGKATKANIIATAGAFTPQQTTCMRDAFLRVRAPCPSAAGAQATAEIKVSFEK